MQKSFWLVLVLVIGGLFGLFILTDSGDGDSNLETYDPTVVRIDDQIDGIEVPSTQEELDAALEGKAVVIEYADFQCPGCSFFYSVLAQLKLDFAGDLVVVFRHFPLTNIHPQAMSAHRAAVAAANQGAFWGMHDLLYERQQEWSGVTNAADLFEAYATDLSLDVDQFKTDRDSTVAFDLINNDVESAAAYNVTGTPTVIFNGEKLQTTPSYEDFKQLIEDYLNPAEN